MESSSEGLSIHDSKKVLESLERRSFCCSWFPRLFSIGTNRDRFGFKNMGSECKIRERNPSETPISKRGYDLDLEIWLKTRICQFCQMHV